VNAVLLYDNNRHNGRESVMCTVDLNTDNVTECCQVNAVLLYDNNRHNGRESVMCTVDLDTDNVTEYCQ
ncbi:hypothetical protein J6590_105981, partial [Homalodisca vitripennis]